jgi:hypothetical protein
MAKRLNLTTKGLGLKEHRIPDYSKRIREAVLYSCSVAIADPRLGICGDDTGKSIL